MSSRLVAARRGAIGVVRLRRARVALVLAAVAAVIISALELPLGELQGERRTLAVVTGQLAAAQRADQALRADLRALQQPTRIAAIAHQDYGLVRPGQQAYVVLPSAKSRANLGAPARVPASDLVPSSASAYPVPDPSAPGGQQSLWQKTLDHLEFWRSVF